MPGCTASRAGPAARADPPLPAAAGPGDPKGGCFINSGQFSQKSCNTLVKHVTVPPPGVTMATRRRLSLYLSPAQERSLRDLVVELRNDSLLRALQGEATPTTALRYLVYAGLDQRARARHRSRKRHRSRQRRSKRRPRLRQQRRSNKRAFLAACAGRRRRSSVRRARSQVTPTPTCVWAPSAWRTTGRSAMRAARCRS